MFVVLFEVQPRPDRWDDYLATARLLRPELEAIDGFVENVRYRGDNDAGRILSLSTWRDEKALVRWRAQATHHTAGQTRGRFEIFADYRLRVGEVTADTDAPPGAVLDQTRFDVTAVGLATVLTLVEGLAAFVPLGESAGAAGPVEATTYAALDDPDRRIVVHGWAGAEAGTDVPAMEASSVRLRSVRVIREYGMRDRREAPQYLPDVG